MSKESETLFCKVAVEKAWITVDQAHELRQALKDARGLGVKVDMPKMASDRGLLDKDQILDIRRELRKRGVNPMVAGYEILSRLGDGGMGSVFKARDPKTGDLVAIKVLSSHLAKEKRYLLRFEKEARLAARIQHKNGVRVMDVGVDGSRHYIIMEFVDGKSLEDRILAGHTFSETDCLKIAWQLCGVLAEAHKQGIVHRDIKPANILLSSKGVAKLADLGIAKATEDGTPTLTQANELMGTPYYMSPEQCRSSKTVDARSDIYSLGATLYHILTGQTPYDADSVAMVIHQQEKSPVPMVRKACPSVSEQTNSLVWKMMAKTPDARPQDMAMVLDHIKLILKSLGRTPKPESTPDAPAAAPSPASGPAADREAFASATQDLLLPAQADETGRQLILRTRALDRRLKLLDEFHDVWEKWLELIQEARQSKSSLAAVQGDFEDVCTFIKENYTAAVNVLRQERHGGRVIDQCGDAKLDRFRAMPEEDFAPIKDSWEQGEELLNQFESFLADSRRDILRQNWFRYYWAKYMQTTKAKVAVFGLIAAIVGGGVYAGVKKWATGPGGKLVKSNKRPAPGFDNPVGSEPEASIPKGGAYKGPVPKTAAELHAALKSVNPDYTGKGAFSVRDGRVRTVYLRHCGISDLSPVRGMTLRHLNCADNRIEDLTPLAEVRLQELLIGRNPVRDITPLRQTGIKQLNIPRTQVTDLSPLSGTSIDQLDIYWTPIADVSPLLDVPLVALCIRATVPPGGMERLRNHKTLKYMQPVAPDVSARKVPVAEFWRRWDAGEFGKPKTAAIPKGGR